MLAAEATTPFLRTTPGIVTPTAEWLSSNRSSSVAITLATALGLDSSGVSIRSRSAENSPVVRSTGAALMPLPPKSMPIGICHALQPSRAPARGARECRRLPNC